jgi:hypothetical protein
LHKRQAPRASSRLEPLSPACSLFALAASERDPRELPEQHDEHQHDCDVANRGHQHLSRAHQQRPLAERPQHELRLLWRRLAKVGAGAAKIESGQAKSITDLAEQEGVTDAYVCRLLPLTCLAPDIVEAILDGRQPKGLRLAQMLGDGPVGWEEQRLAFSFRQSG